MKYWLRIAVCNTGNIMNKEIAMCAMPQGNICFCFIKYIFYVKLLLKRVWHILFKWIPYIINTWSLSSKAVGHLKGVYYVHWTCLLNGRAGGDWFKNLICQNKLLTLRYLMWSFMLVNCMDNILTFSVLIPNFYSINAVLSS